MDDERAPEAQVDQEQAVSSAAAEGHNQTSSGVEHDAGTGPIVGESLEVDVNFLFFFSRDSADYCSLLETMIRHWETTINRKSMRVSLPSSR